MRRVLNTVFLVILSFTWISATEVHENEYCLRTDSESFQAQCASNEVIIMTYAVYGRMKIGKCLESEGEKILESLANDPGFLGCSKDVLSLMDEKCSGKNQCEVKGTDSDLLQNNPCHRELKSYLKAGYYCTKVVVGDGTCRVNVTDFMQNIQPLSRTSGSGHNCGSTSFPWNLEAPEGQQIHVNLIEFGESSKQINCRNNPRGYIYDKSIKYNISLCPEYGDRITSLFTSGSNKIQIVLSEQGETTSSSFLVPIIAMGCKDFVPPVDAWLRRDGNSAVVGCYTSRQSWDLKCFNNQWVGHLGNCSKDYSDDRFEDDFQKSSPLGMMKSTEVIAIVSISVTSIIIFSVMIMIGLICWRRYNIQTKTLPYEKQDFVKDSQFSEKSGVCHVQVAA